MQLKNLVNLVEILLAQVHLVLTQEALQEQSQVQPLVRLTLEAHLTQPLLPLALIVRPAQLLLQLVLIVPIEAAIFIGALSPVVGLV